MKKFRIWIVIAMAALSIAGVAQAYNSRWCLHADCNCPGYAGGPAFSDYCTNCGHQKPDHA